MSLPPKPTYKSAMGKRAGSVFSVDFIDPSRDATRPAHARISERLRAAILSGALARGTRLPSSRSLAADFGVARNTVDWAIGELVADGYVVRRRGAGSFVAENLPEHGAPSVAPKAKARAEPAAHLSARAEALRAYPGSRLPVAATSFLPSLPPPDIFPRKIWNRLLAREAGRPGDSYWEYGASNGLPALREAIAVHASAMRGVRATADQVIVLTSTQQAFELAARVVADPGESAWVETPGYQPLIHCLRATGLEVVPVPVDDDGLDVAAGRALAADARLACVTPSHQFPLGVEMSPARRKALLDWAVQANAYVVEDDYDGDYRYEGRPLGALQGMDDAGRTIYVGSFNKILFSGLRIAYAVVPESLIDAFVDAKHIADGHTALLTQGVLAAFIAEGHLAAHLRRSRAIYSERRRVFLDAAVSLSDLLSFGPVPAGTHITARFRDDGIDDREVVRTCAERGVDLRPLSRYGATPTGGLVFGFANIEGDAARRGLDVVREAIKLSLAARQK